MTGARLPGAARWLDKALRQPRYRLSETVTSKRAGYRRSETVNLPSAVRCRVGGGHRAAVNRYTSASAGSVSPNAAASVMLYVPRRA